MKFKDKTKKDNSGKILADFINEFCFGAFVNRMCELMGKKAASGVLRDTSMKVMENIISKKKKKNAILKKMKGKSLGERLKICYTLLEEVYPFECHLKFAGKNKDEMILWVTKCPHIEFTKKNPIACWVCAGMKLGVLKTAGIKKPWKIFEVRKRLALGDDHCEIVIKKTKGKIKKNIDK